MSVYYKFKSAVSFDTIQFDDIHISLSDFKKAVCEQKQFGKNSNFDLQVTNAETDEAYKDDTDLIPKNSSLIVVRVPVDGQKKNWESTENSNSNTNNNSVSELIEGDLGKKLIQAVDFTTSDASEEDKIKAMMFQSTVEYDPSNYKKIKGGNQQGPVPANYVCRICNSPGHWINDCLLRNAGVAEIKKSSGIPQCFMMPVEGPSVPGALMTPGGSFAIPTIDYQAYQQGKKEKHFADENEQPVIAKPDIPEDLACSLCHDLLVDVVMIPCCGTSFCDECIRNALVESADNQCPDCKEKDVSPDTLIPNRFLRARVSKFCDQTGYKGSQNRPQPRQSESNVMSLTTTVLDHGNIQQKQEEIGAAISVVGGGGNNIQVVSLHNSKNIEKIGNLGRHANSHSDAAPEHMNEHPPSHGRMRTDEGSFSPSLQDNKHGSPHHIIPGHGPGSGHGPGPSHGVGPGHPGHALGPGQGPGHMPVPDYNIPPATNHMAMPPFNQQQPPHSMMTRAVGPQFTSGPPPMLQQPPPFGHHHPGMNTMLPPPIMHQVLPQYPGQQQGAYNYHPGMRMVRGGYRRLPGHPMAPIANEFENKENYDMVLHAFERRLQEKEKQDEIRRAKHRRSRSRSHSRHRVSTSRPRSHSPHSRSKSPSARKESSPHRSKKKVSRSPSQKPKRSASRSRSPVRKISRLRTRSRSESRSRTPRRSHSPVVVSKKKRSPSVSPVKIKKKRRTSHSRSRSRSPRAPSRSTRNRSYSRPRSYSRSVSRGRSFSRSRTPSPRNDRFNSPYYDGRSRGYYKNNISRPYRRYGEYRHISPGGQPYQDSNNYRGQRGRGRGGFRYHRGRYNDFQQNHDNYNRYGPNSDRKYDNRNNRGYGGPDFEMQHHHEKQGPNFYDQQPPPFNNFSQSGGLDLLAPPGTSGEVFIDNYQNIPHQYGDYERNKPSNNYINSDNLMEIPISSWEKPRGRDSYEKPKDDYQKNYHHHHHYREHRDRESRDYDHYEHRDHREQRDYEDHERSKSRHSPHKDSRTSEEHHSHRSTSTELEKSKKKKDNELKEKKEKTKRKKKKNADTENEKKKKKKSKKIKESQSQDDEPEKKPVEEGTELPPVEVEEKQNEEIPKVETKSEPKADVAVSPKKSGGGEVEDNNELPASIIEAKPEPEPAEVMLASIPEKSKWEFDDDLVVIEDRDIETIEIHSPPKVTNEIIKRAENVLFQKAGKLPTPAPVAATKSSDVINESNVSSRKAERAGNSIQVTVPSTKSSDEKPVEIKSKSSEERTRISAKERLGAKIDSKKSDYSVKSAVVKTSVKLVDPKYKSVVHKVEKTSHRHKETKDEKKNSHDIHTSKPKERKEKHKEESRKSKNEIKDNKPKVDLKSKESKPIKIMIESVPEKKITLDVEDNFEPDYDLTTGSESDHAGVKNDKPIKNNESGKGTNNNEVSSKLTEKHSSETESSDENSSVESSSGSSREERKRSKKKKKKSKKKKRKHSKKKKDVSSDSEESLESDSEDDEELKSKRKHKHRRKSKKSRSGKKKKKSKK